MPEQYFTIEELATEEWRQCPDYEGIYEVSSLGRVRRIKTHQEWAASSRSRAYYRETRTGYPMKTLTAGQYPRLSLRKDGRQRSMVVHKLVAAAFVCGPCQPKQEVNHKDGVKHNNRASNLEWTTRQGNADHASMMGLLPSGLRNGAYTHPEKVHKGEHNGQAKLTDTAVTEIKALIRSGVPQSILARRYKVSTSAIQFIRKGTTWRHID